MVCGKRFEDNSKTEQVLRIHELKCAQRAVETWRKESEKQRDEKGFAEEEDNASPCISKVLDWGEVMWTCGKCGYKAFGPNGTA